jgi:outer membrane receptor protein involved in Fe transport
MIGLKLEGTVFYSDVRDLIQTVVLAGNTTQTQNVGDGRFYGVEFAVDAPISPAVTVGGHYTAISARSTTRCCRTCGRQACRRTRPSCTQRGGRLTR